MSRKTDSQGATEESRLWTEMSDLLLGHVVSLCRQVPGKRPEHIGTGILVEWSGQSFLISARHVFKDASSLFFYVDTHTVRKLTGRLILGKPEGNLPDRIDVAVLRLEGEGLPPYPQTEKYALDGASRILARALPRSGKNYLVTGFPRTRTRANPHSLQLVSAAQSLIATSAEVDKYVAVGVSEQTHIVLPLNRRETIGTAGELRVFPDPHGMSGSPVWLLPDEINRLELPMLVGVLTEFHEDEGAIVATDIGEVLRQIVQLQGSIR